MRAGLSQERKRLEDLAAGIGRAIGESIEGEFGARQVGYAVLIFDFGESGTMAYAANAKREDMIKALAELLGNLRGS